MRKERSERKDEGEERERKENGQGNREQGKEVLPNSLTSGGRLWRPRLWSERARALG